MRCPDAASSSCGWLSIGDATWGRTMPWPGRRDLRLALCAPPLCPASSGARSGPEWPPHTCTPVSSRELGHASLKPSCQTWGRRRKKPFPLRNHLSSFTPGPRPPPASRWWAKGQAPVWLPFFCTSYTSLRTVGHLFFLPLVLCPKSWDRKCPLKNSITWRIVLHL